MRSILALPVGGLLVVIGGLFVAPEAGTAARVSARISSSLFAQMAPAALPQRSINLTEEDRHTIREIVLNDPAKKESANVKVEIGDKVPTNITTYEFPPLALNKIPALKAHRYFIADDQVVVVDTGDGVNGGKVADIVKAK